MDARNGLERLNELEKAAPGEPKAGAVFGLAVEAEDKAAKPPQAPETKTYSAGALVALSDKLQDEGGKDWREEVAETQAERNILDLVTGILE